MPKLLDTSHAYVRSLRPVDRLNGTDPGVFRRRYARRSRPVVIEGALADCKALDLWTNDYLKERVGDRPIPVEYSLRPIYRPNPRVSGSQYHRKALRFSDGLDLIASQARQRMWYYASTLPLETHFPELEGDVVVPAFLAPKRFRTSALFMGNDGTGTQFHYDLTTNFLAVFKGMKRVYLVAPRQSRRLYPLGVGTELCNFSRLDFDQPDPATYPRAARLDLLECEVGPGEMLFLPGLWWHFVVNVGLTVGVSFVWDSPAHRMWEPLAARFYLARRVVPRVRHWLSRMRAGRRHASPA